MRLMNKMFGSRLWVRTQHSEFRDWLSKRQTRTRKTICCKPYLIYLFGRWDIFLVDLHPIRSNIAIATVLYRDQRKLDALRHEINQYDPRVEVRQIFKTYRAKTYSKKRVRAFLGILAANLLGLMHGKTICIRTLDGNHELRSLAYATFTEINKGEQYGCQFDYDVYDLRLDLKEYANDSSYWLIALIDTKVPFPNRRVPEV